MPHAQAVLSPAEAARHLGISSKALRLYEERGFITPIRNAAGWRHYGPGELARVRQIMALRSLGLSLGQIDQVLAGRGERLDEALAGHQGRLEAGLANLLDAIERVRLWRNDLLEGRLPELAELAERKPEISFTLPWPWAGETFEINRLAPVTYLVGPLGSGKTRLAMALAAATGGRFVSLERPAPEELPPGAAEALAWLTEDGAHDTPALRALLAAIAGDHVHVIDLVEDGLNEPTQLALGAWLRRKSSADNPLIVMTRSSAILDLDAVSDGHAILHCPANHAPPFFVATLAGVPGYESVANCLGSVAARSRVAGVKLTRAG